VDARRIGCVGLSIGALRSAHLAALDDRIKPAVVVGWMTGVAGHAGAVARHQRKQGRAVRALRRARQAWS